MTKLISESGLVMSGDSDNSVVINLKNMKSSAKGYYQLSDTEIITFLTTKKSYIHFDQDSLLYIKDQENDEYLSKLKSKNVFIKDHSSLIFNRPTKKNLPVLLESVTKHSGESLNASYSYNLLSTVKDIDNSILEILKLEKEKEEKEYKKKNEKKERDKKKEKEENKTKDKQTRVKVNKDSKSRKDEKPLPKKVEDSDSDDDDDELGEDDEEDPSELDEVGDVEEGEESEEEEEKEHSDKDESDEEEESEKDKEESNPEEELTDDDESGEDDIEIPKYRESKGKSKELSERREHMVSEANRIVSQISKAISVVQHSNRKIKPKEGNGKNKNDSEKPRVKPTVKTRKQT